MKKKNLHNDKEGFKVPKDYFENFEEKLFDKISKDKEDSSTLSDALTSGFTAPKGYLDNFEEQLLQKLPKHKEETAVLDTIAKNSFKTPDNYFNTLESKVLEQTVGSHKESKVISLFSRKNIVYVSGLAAMIAILISIALPSGSKIEDPFSSVEIADIQEYFDDGNVEFSDLEIAELLDEETSLANTFVDEEISEEELEDYLYDEELSEDMIYVE
ncbi:hypothetical protein [Aquimarina litoralis]|uniref:hypothetical protein n=1 Tax=Aquimarina litoralis TaxID=584605 RepID=UPI001C566563|nr:hypothetical protein [Aquimarina litoralis]MBW1295730.1 hypothetical protein [Aquimarina litoralis]